MDVNFGNRLKELRESKNLSLNDLGILSDVSKQTIHRYEQNVKSPSSSTLLKISKALKVHPSIFFHEEDLNIQIEKINFREEDNLLNSTFSRAQIEDVCKDYLLKFLELESLLDLNAKFENPLKGFEISTKKDVEKAAKNLRKKWGLGTAPISDVTQLIESNGVFVIEINEINEFTGLSGFANQDIPFIVINENCIDKSRKRFTLLHELGHLVLEFSDQLNNDIIERLCHHFAGAVLLVEDTLFIELGKNRTSISLHELKSIKEKYGVSIQAIIIRAKAIGLISNQTYNEWWELYNEWYGDSNNTQQFGTISCSEKPTKFDNLIFRGIKEQRFTWGKAARLKNTKVDILKKELDELEFIVG